MRFIGTSPTQQDRSAQPLHWPWEEMLKEAMELTVLILKMGLSHGNIAEAKCFGGETWYLV